MNLFGMIDQSGSAMQAERMRAEVVAANMANAETTRTAAGTPYQRQHVVFAAADGDGNFQGQLLRNLPLLPLLPATSANPWVASPTTATNGTETVSSGVRVSGVVTDTAPALKRFDPGHPDADAEGYVAYPDINPLTEMVDLMGATRAYGLNSSAVQAEKSMIASSLEIAK